MSACEGAGRLWRATEAGSNYKPNELAAFTITVLTHIHTLLSAGSHFCLNPGTQRKKEERRERGSDRQRGRVRAPE